MLDSKPKFNRIELLERQFYYLNYFHNNHKVKESLNRVKLYLLDHTTIYYIDFVKASELYGYIRKQKSTDFSEVSFLQALKDIKYFINYFRFYSNKKLEIDLSLLNHDLWLSL